MLLTGDRCTGALQLRQNACSWCPSVKSWRVPGSRPSRRALLRLTQIPQWNSERWGLQMMLWDFHKRLTEINKAKLCGIHGGKPLLLSRKSIPIGCQGWIFAGCKILQKTHNCICVTQAESSLCVWSEPLVSLLTHYHHLILWNHWLDRNPKRVTTRLQSITVIQDATEVRIMLIIS